MSSIAHAQVNTVKYAAFEAESRTCLQYSFAQAIDWSCSHQLRFTPTLANDAPKQEFPKQESPKQESPKPHQNQQAIKSQQKMMQLLEQADDSLADEDYAQAELAYRQAIKLQPGSSLARIKLGFFYTALDRETDALQSLQYGLESIPDNADIIHEIGMIQVRLRQLSKAIVSLAKAAILAPENPHYSYVYGIAMNSYQRPVEALDILQQALARHPQYKPILNALLAINQDNQHFPEALYYAEKLLALDAENPDYQMVVRQLKLRINLDKK